MGGKLVMRWAAAMLVLAVPAAALSASRGAQHAGGGQERLALRAAGGGPSFTPHPALDMTAALIRPQPLPAPPEPLPQDAEMAPPRPHAVPAVRRLDAAAAVPHWYAVASAGSGAIALLPGHARAQGLYWQKRARIRGGQLGLSRDAGAAKVTVGYLLTNPGRDPLVPFYKGRARQNLAALSLSVRK